MSIKQNERGRVINKKEKGKIQSKRKIIISKKCKNKMDVKLSPRAKKKKIYKFNNNSKKRN